jgi:hypothetical protein
VIQREAPDVNRARVFVRFETRNQLAWVGFGLIAVILTLPGAVGFAFVGVTCIAGSVYFFSEKINS